MGIDKKCFNANPFELGQIRKTLI
ncbi:hypothetical protein CY0110_16697 [Crocosphaera chwakensis CCY0110]|uniref:Uncharacterized protein n=1 Tax=Crocosphaera chwakensis CCY0110 TaxID=391612 RepID=A3II21_9CHRO|nr:hypothetical protein CY0110_16697 [Crocosphaera chwakensis CCY0110]